MISMGMMVVMFGGIMIISARSAKKAAEEEFKKQDKVNPYKESKKTGKSVEEIVDGEDILTIEPLEENNNEENNN